MKKWGEVSALLAVLAWGATPAYADDWGTDSFGSVFIIVFLAYCVLIAVSHLAEFLRLRFARKGELPEKALEEG